MDQIAKTKEQINSLYGVYAQILLKKGETTMKTIKDATPTVTHIMIKGKPADFQDLLEYLGQYLDARQWYRKADDYMTRHRHFARYLRPREILGTSADFWVDDDHYRLAVTPVTRTHGPDTALFTQYKNGNRIQTRTIDKLLQSMIDWMVKDTCPEEYY